MSEPGPGSPPDYAYVVRRAREHAFENLFDAVVVTDLEGRVVDWNRGSERLYGYTRAEMLGQPVSILHLPEHREHVLSEVLGAIERDGRWQGEVGLLRKDGSRGWIESSVVPLFDDAGQPVGALGINRDISDRVAAENELRAAETRFRSLVEHSLVGIHILRDDRLVYVNPRFEEIFGYTAKELLDGVSVFDLIAEEDRDRIRANVRRRMEGEKLEARYAFRATRKDGTDIRIQVHGTPIDLEDGPAVIGMVQDVTEQQVAEERLRASEERYRLIAAASTDVFRDWDVAAGTVTWGPSAAQALHYDPADMGGGLDWWSSRIHPDDRSGVVRSLYAVLEGTGDSWSAEYRFRRGVGEYVVFLDRACVVRSPSGEPTRVMSSMHDITGRRRTEEVQSFLASASATLDASLDGDAILSTLARISVPFLADCCLVHVAEPGTGRLRQVASVHADPAVQSRLGFPDPSHGGPEYAPVRTVVGTAEPMLVTDLDRDPRFDAAADPYARACRELDLRSVMVVPLVARGEALGAMTLGAADSRRRYTAMDLATAEDLAARAAQALDNAMLYNEAREAVQARSRLFADISHEFRTPLMLALGPLDDLLDGLHGTLDPDQETQVRQARRNAGRVLELVNQILELARLEAKGMPTHLRHLDLGALVAAAAAEFAPLAERRGLDLRVKVPEGPVPLHADPELLGKVLSNLLSNALKFTPAGGNVQVVVETTDESARLSIRDSGPGIPAGELDKVFDRFHRVDGQESRSAGSGIGLALTRQLVELHSGEIGVESEEGAGSTFSAVFPLADPSEEDIARPSPEEIARLALRLPELAGDVTDATAAAGDEHEDVTTILLVEDDAEVRGFLRKHLARRYRVLEAADGRRGIDIARRALPDLVLSDVMMPGMDGLELCRALKRDPETDFIPVVLLSARAAPEDRLRGLEEEADDYLTKPVRPDELLARTANLLASRKRLRERFAAPPLTLHPRDVDVESADQRFLDQVRTAIEANLGDENYSVERLASDVAHSRSHLYRRLRDLLDESPSDLIRRIRLERAAQLLEGGAGSVSSIAYSVGFKSVSHFSNRFQETFGTRPSTYRGEA